MRMGRPFWSEVSSMFGRIEDIVRTSGKRVRDASGFTVENKGTRENLVTSMDIENEIFLRRELTSLIPGSTFMGEEGDDARVSDEGYTWVVDPIDGTANFSRGIPMVGISVALFKDGEPHMGFVHNPFTDTTYSAGAGEGAFRNGERVHVSDRELADCIMCTAWCTYETSMAPGCFRVSERMHPMCNDIRRIGTAAVELGLLSEGAVDLYFEIRLSPWDYSAGLLCVKEAGGCYTGIDGDVDWNEPSPVIAANNESNMETILGVVRDEFDGKRPY